MYVVANPVRGLLHRKRSEEHLQSFNESMETKTKQKTKQNDKNKGTTTQNICQKNIEGIW